MEKPKGIEWLRARCDRGGCMDVFWEYEKLHDAAKEVVQKSWHDNHYTNYCVPEDPTNKLRDILAAGEGK